MDNYKLINKFFQIQPSESFAKDIFATLKEFLPLNSAYIYFDEPRKLEYSFNAKDDICEPYLKEELKIKNTKFGEIIITGNFTDEQSKDFKICALIISNLIKDYELSKIMKAQTETLQQSYSQIKSNNLKLKQSEEIKSKFLSHVSHELRTPLNSILGFSDLLGNEFVGSLNEKQKEYINDIKVSGLHLLGMINEILDMSKIEAGSMKLNIKEFDITQLIQETINIINPLALKKNINLKQNIQNFSVKADYQKFQQILFNLLSNAIKFTNKNGEISIVANLDKQNMEISISDNGIGIAQENLEKIFDKFEQVSENTETSTGLGLTITKELVKLHNGEIFVKSELNKGSEFTIKIPIVKQEEIC